MFLHLSVILCTGRGVCSQGVLVLRGGIPACTEADPTSRWLLLRTVRVLLECILFINLDFAEGAAAAARSMQDDTVMSLEALSNDTVSCQNICPKVRNFYPEKIFSQSTKSSLYFFTLTLRQSQDLSADGWFNQWLQLL